MSQTVYQTVTQSQSASVVVSYVTPSLVWMLVSSCGLAELCTTYTLACLKLATLTSAR